MKIKRKYNFLLGLIILILGTINGVLLLRNRWKRKHDEAITAWTIESNNKDKQILKLQEELKNLKEKPVKHGKWLSRCEGDIYDFIECSECGNTESCETPYCAQCGARMDGEDNA